MKLITHFLPVLRLRSCGALPPLIHGMYFSTEIPSWCINVWPIYMQLQATWFTLHVLIKRFIDYFKNGIFNTSAQSGIERNHNTLQLMECAYYRPCLEIFIMGRQPPLFSMYVNNWKWYKSIISGMEISVFIVNLLLHRNHQFWGSCLLASVTPGHEPNTFISSGHTKNPV
jgi:hypothetical protein